MQNYMRKSCNKTCRKFFEDFDLLPRELKEILWYQPNGPTMEDLRAAWQLAGENWSLESVLANLNVFEEDRKAAKEAEAKRKRDQAKRDKDAKRLEKYRGRAQYVNRVVTVPRPKDARLVAIVTEEQAMEALSKRKENKDVKQVATFIVRQFVGYSKEAVTEKVDDTKYMETQPSLSMAKQLHNY